MSMCTMGLSANLLRGHLRNITPVFWCLHSKANFSAQLSSRRNKIELNDITYVRDEWTNITPRIQSNIGKNIHNKKYHPINHIKRRIENYFYKNYVNRVGNPLYTVVDNLSPVVTTYQNFDSLLVPDDHVSRSRSDSYYINQTHMLRAHTSAHQEELMKSGLDKFLVVGDVYRRDTIDRSHYPVFHQMEGVCLFTRDELFANQGAGDKMDLFENSDERFYDKQESHTELTSQLLERHLKTTLVNLASSIFGDDLEYKWVDQYFPFTHPSWELEIKFEGEWLEVLGCGIMEQQLLRNAGAGSKVGWAFGLGLDRLAMRLYQIPHIRLLWSDDDRFINQFKVTDPNTPITFKAFSNQPANVNDISFWLPDSYDANDFYDLVRDVQSDVIEEVKLIDEYTNKKTSRTSHCYRITYRHINKSLSQKEIESLHNEIRSQAALRLNVELR